MPMLTAQDALLPGNQLQVSTSSSWNDSCIWQQSTSYNSTHSSAESELYAICTGVNEGLHLRNFLLETNNCSKLNLRIHTDSTAGKSIATRQGTSKRAKHIDLQFLYTQDLIRTLKINTLHNSAALFTKHIARKHYTGSFRALGYAFSTTNNQRNCFTTTTASSFCM